MLGVAYEIIATQPVLAAIAALGLGYLIGQLNIGGSSLAVGAALTAGLALSACVASAQMNRAVALIGTIIFFYGTGILYGRRFFEAATGTQNRNYNLLALASIIAWLLVALPLGAAFKIKIAHGGSITSTAADGHRLLILTESADFAVAPYSPGVEGEPCSRFSEL